MESAQTVRFKPSKYGLNMESKYLSNQNLKRYEHFILEFYNRIAVQELDRYEQIPADVRVFLSYLDYEDIIKPFASEDLAGGSSRENVSIKYGVSASISRRIGQKCGFFSPTYHQKPVKINQE